MFNLVSCRNDEDASSNTTGAKMATRRFLFQVIINSIALFFTLLLFRLIRLPDASGQMVPVFTIDDLVLWMVPILGLIFTGIGWVLRPVLLMLFGRLVIQTLGLFLFVIDALVFWLTTRVSPFEFNIAPPVIVWTLIAALFYGLFKFVVSALVGVDRPQVERDASSAAVWKRLENLPGVRNSRFAENLRLQQVYDMLGTFALELAMDRTALSSFRRTISNRVYGKPNPVEDMTQPEKVRVMLQQLGPTYVKFGQMAASQGQALPSEYEQELEKLQNTVPPVPYEQAREVIVQELGKPPEELFATFEREAFAAASTAQVHKATLHDGTPVAVKVQRPDIVTMVNADLGILRQVSQAIARVNADARAIDLQGIVEEFAYAVRRELDYHNEAYHARRLGDNMKSQVGVQVYRVYPEFSSTRVLTMEFVRGVKITNTPALDEAGLDREDLGRRFVRAVLKQVIVDGFFHADPHPGNLLVDPQTGTLTFIDLGQVGVLDAPKRLDVIDLVVSLTQQDAGAIADVFLRLSRHLRPVDVAAYRRDMEDYIAQYLVYGTYGPGATLSSFVSRLLALLQAHGLRLDRQLTLGLKAIAQCEETLFALGTQFNVITFANEQLPDFAIEAITPQKVSELVKQQLTATAKQIVRRVPNLPDATMMWLDQYLSGKFTVHLDTSDLGQHVDNFGVSVRRLTAGLVMTGMIIGTAIVASQFLVFQSANASWLPIFAVGVFVVMVSVGINVIWNMLRGTSDRT